MLPLAPSLKKDVFVILVYRKPFFSGCVSALRGSARDWEDEPERLLCPETKLQPGLGMNDKVNIEAQIN
jgi:hypothetical protein